MRLCVGGVWGRGCGVAIDDVTASVARRFNFARGLIQSAPSPHRPARARHLTGLTGGLLRVRTPSCADAKVGCQRPACLELWRIRATVPVTVELSSGEMVQQVMTGHDTCPMPVRAAELWRTRARARAV